MNKVHFLTTFFLLSGSISAQHKIDLSKITPPAINYLELGHTGPAGKEIRVNNLYLEEGGIPQLPVMGEIHYNRMDHRYWRDALLKMKASGIDIVATYCIWSLHEEVEGELSWEGPQPPPFYRIMQRTGHESALAFRSLLQCGNQKRRIT